MAEKQLSEFSLTERTQILTEVSQLLAETEDTMDAVSYADDFVDDHGMSSEDAKKIIERVAVDGQWPEETK